MGIIENIRSYILDSSFRINVFENKINIVNYTSLGSIEQDKISVKHDSKIIIIKGNNLSIVKLLDDEILITGNIDNIEFR